VTDSKKEKKTLNNIHADIKHYCRTTAGQTLLLFNWIWILTLKRNI